MRKYYTTIVCVEGKGRAVILLEKSVDPNLLQLAVARLGLSVGRRSSDAIHVWGFRASGRSAGGYFCRSCTKENGRLYIISSPVTTRGGIALRSVQVGKVERYVDKQDAPRHASPRSFVVAFTSDYIQYYLAARIYYR